MRKNLLIFLLFLVVMACKKESKIQNDVAEIDVDFYVERFEKVFNESKPNDLPKTQRDVSFFLSKAFLKILYGSKK